MDRSHRIVANKLKVAGEQCITNRSRGEGYIRRTGQYRLDCLSNSYFPQIFFARVDSKNRIGSGFFIYGLKEFFALPKGFKPCRSGFYFTPNML